MPEMNDNGNTTPNAFSAPQQTGPAPEQPPRVKAQQAAAWQTVPQSAQGQQTPQGQQAPGWSAPGQQAAYQQVPYQGYPAYQAPQVVYAVPPEQNKSRKWIVAIVVIVCLFAFTAFCVKSCTDAVTSIGSTTGGSTIPSGNAIAVINIDGTIQYDGTACSPEGLKELLDEASENDNVKAVVLRVNSGGGTATAGEEMATYLNQFDKPVVVSSASINASAAYEISSQSDYIFVAKSTEIGAIGTAMQFTDISGLLDMFGVNMEVITSAEDKDSTYGYRPLTDEERAEYQRMVDQINDMFIQNVADGRHMTVENVRALATGMIFTGVDAVGNGLADEIGTLEDAADKAAELAGVSDYTLFTLDFYDYDLSSLYYLLGGSSSESQLALPLLKN